nr:MAG: nonstructural protein [Riboviria sp.]WKV33894.1 MAG: RNA-dependent RNA polymerase [Riboviria sp.]
MVSLWFPSLSKTLARKLRVQQPSVFDEGDVDVGEVFVPPYVVDKPEFATHYSFDRPIQPHQLYARCVINSCCTKPACVPVASLENDEACIQNRVEMVRNQTRLTKKYRRLAREYQHAVARHVGDITPWLHQAVIEEMPRADRAKKLDERLHELAYAKMGDMRTFQKAEAYDGLKAPRNISPVPDEQLLEMSRFVYPFVKALKNARMNWWAPGNTPLQTAEQVARVTRKGPGTYFGADYSKFDGHQNRHLRRIVRDIIAECLPDGAREEWIQRFEMEISAKAKTQFGVKYNANGTMLSGSAITTVGNTLLNGFIYYCAARRAGISEGTVIGYMSNNCILYGDDSAGPARIQLEFLEVCKDLGVSATLEDCGEGLIFLGRLYYRDGEIHSIFDPRRLMPKIHITCSSAQVPLPIAACNRAHRLKASCKGEVWVETICNAILRDWGDNPEEEKWFSAEEKFNLERRESLGLPEHEVPHCMVLVERLLGLPNGLLSAVLYDYDK